MVRSATLNLRASSNSVTNTVPSTSTTTSTSSSSRSPPLILRSPSNLVTNTVPSTSTTTSTSSSSRSPPLMLRTPSRSVTNTDSSSIATTSISSSSLKTSMDIRTMRSSGSGTTGIPYEGSLPIITEKAIDKSAIVILQGQKSGDLSFVNIGIGIVIDSGRVLTAAKLLLGENDAPKYSAIQFTFNYEMVSAKSIHISNLPDHNIAIINVDAKVSSRNIVISPTAPRPFGAYFVFTMAENDELAVYELNDEAATLYFKDNRPSVTKRDDKKAKKNTLKKSKSKKIQLKESVNLPVIQVPIIRTFADLPKRSVGSPIVQVTDEAIIVQAILDDNFWLSHIEQTVIELYQFEEDGTIDSAKFTTFPLNPLEEYAPLAPSVAPTSSQIQTPEPKPKKTLIGAFKKALHIGSSSSGLKVIKTSTKSKEKQEKERDKEEKKEKKRKEKQDKNEKKKEKKDKKNKEDKKDKKEKKANEVEEPEEDEDIQIDE